MNTCVSKRITVLGWLCGTLYTFEQMFSFLVLNRENGNFCALFMKWRLCFTHGVRQDDDSNTSGPGSILGFLVLVRTRRCKAVI